METEKFEIYFLIVICFIFIVIGSIGNVISIVIFSHKDLKKHSTSVYLRFSSFVNLITLFYLPVMTVPSIWPISTFFCKIFLAIMMLLIEIQSWIVTFCSLDRLVTVVKPHKFLFKNKFKFQLGIVIGALVTIFCLNFPYLYFYEKEYHHSGQTMCLLPKEALFLQAYTTYEYIFVRVLIPFSLMIVSSLMIVKKVSKNKMLLMVSFNSRFKVKYRMVKVFLITDTFFLIFRIPMVFYTLLEYDEGKIFYNFFFSICVLLGSIHNAFVFIIFLLFNKFYRFLFFQYFTKFKKFILLNCVIVKKNNRVFNHKF